MLSKLKIAHKIYLMAFIQLSLMVLIGMVGILQMDKIGKEIVEIAEEDLPLTKSLMLITEHQLQQAILFEKALFKGALMKQGFAGAEESFHKARKQTLKLTKQVHKEIIETEEFIQKVIPLLHSQAAIDEFNHLYKQLKVVEGDYNILERDAAQVLDLIGQGKLAESIDGALKLEKLEEKLDDSLVAMLNEVQQFTLDAAIKAEHDEKEGIKLIITVFVVSLLIASGLSFWIAGAITRPIKVLRERLKQVADGDGDLTVRLDESANDESGDVARSFNRFLNKLNNIVCSIGESADDLGKCSETSLRVMEQTLHSVEQQKGETEMVATAVREMGDATREVAKNTSEAADIAENVRQRVSDGKADAVETENIIKQLASEMGNASSVIESLAKETNNIGTVLEAIRGIAEQTNLLALNAAIEAARAGESGRGFAVVADEVRSLAQRTQSSTGDIQTLVESLQTEAANAVASMQKGADSTERCLERSAKTAAALEDANNAVNEISDLNTQIASAAEQQSATSHQINENVANISRIAHETSEGAVKTGEANQQIAKGLISLHTHLDQFQV